MTADEFVQRLSELAYPVEMLHEPDSTILIEMFHNKYFCNKRVIFLNFSNSHNDVILDLIRNYEVDNRTLIFFHDVHFFYSYDDAELDELFTENNSIIIGSDESYTIVINLTDGVIEYRHFETPEAESVLKHHGYRCAFDGEHFLEAGLWFVKNTNPIYFTQIKEDRMDLTNEEKNLMKEIADRCTALAGGSQFADYWYNKCEIY